MSYDIELQRYGVPVDVPAFCAGGTYQAEVDPATGALVPLSLTSAALNVTYNYAHLFAFRDLHGKSAHRTTGLLATAVALFGTTPDANYWAHTPGNVGTACALLLAWAVLNPDAVWEVR